MTDTLFYSVRKVARILGLTPGDVSQLLNDGRMESVYSGPRRLVPVGSVDAYAASLTPVRAL